MPNLFDAYAQFLMRPAPMMQNFYNPGPMHYLANPQMVQGQMQQSSDFLTQHLTNTRPQHSMDEDLRRPA